jgi:hypothetical protein
LKGRLCFQILAYFDLGFELDLIGTIIVSVECDLLASSPHHRAEINGFDFFLLLILDAEGEINGCVGDLDGLQQLFFYLHYDLMMICA